MKLGVALAWHALSWEELLQVTRLAEERGYATLYHDGDVSMLGTRSEAEVLDGWTVSTALLAHTQRIAVSSIRLVAHWNAAHLAQAAVTADRLAPGRTRLFISIGERPEDPRFGYPELSPSQRIAWLAETVEAARALWRGETVTRRGRFVQLDAARVRPRPPGGQLPVEIAGRGRRLLEVVARHADLWNVNLPPVPERVRQATDQLEAACGRIGRNPAEIERSMWIFTRVQPGAQPLDLLGEYRRLNPWFGELGDEELQSSLVVGEAAACAEQLAEIASRLGIERPVVDLSGADFESVMRTLEALPVPAPSR